MNRALENVGVLFERENQKHQPDQKHHGNRPGPSQARKGRGIGGGRAEVRMRKCTHGEGEIRPRRFLHIVSRLRSDLVQPLGPALDAVSPCFEATTKPTLRTHPLLTREVDAGRFHVGSTAHEEAMGGSTVCGFAP